MIEILINGEKNKFENSISISELIVMKNLENLSDTFSCDIISFNPNRNVARKMLKKAFAEIGSPTWYYDALIYAFP